MKTPEEKRLAQKAKSKKWRKSNPEYYKKHYEANREKLLARRALRYKTNRDKELAVQAVYREANREKCRLAGKKWRETNPAKAAISCKNYRTSNPGKVIAAAHRNRARKRNATIGDPKVISKWDKSWRSKKFAICYWCSARVLTKKCHMDHINPIGRTGAHSIENLCISCATCNLRKSASDLQTWNGRIDQPVLF